jgi:hypothetical protein
LLNDIYADIKKQVELGCKFSQPDSFYTMSTDMRQMENGVSVRNYMINLDKVTFMHKGMDVGSERPTAETNAVNNVDAIREVDEDSCAAFTNDNCAAETAAWEPMMDEIPDLLCTGCTPHGGNLLFKKVHVFLSLSQCNHCITCTLPPTISDLYLTVTATPSNSSDLIFGFIWQRFTDTPNGMPVSQDL